MKNYIHILSLGVFLIAGCATVPVLPNKTFVRRSPGYNETMPTVDRIGLLVDGTVTYDGVSTKYVDIEDSRTAISNLTQEAQAELTAKGYELAFVEAPFVGGYKVGSFFPVASTRDTEPQQTAPPFQTAKYIDADPAYRDALKTTTREVMAAVANRSRFPTETLQSVPGAKAALAALAAKKHIHYLFVVQGDGLIESGAKQAGQMIGTAILIGVVSLGTVSGQVHNVSFLDSFVSLVNLQTAEVVWSNSLRLTNFNSAEPSDYQKAHWAHELLYWLPPRGKLEPPPATAQ